MKHAKALLMIVWSAIFLPYSVFGLETSKVKQATYTLNADGYKVKGAELYFDMTLKVKLWTLMGEPVNECVATWDLRSVHFDNGKSFGKRDVPAKVWKEIDVVNAEVAFPIGTTSLINDIPSNYATTYLPCDLGALNGSGDKKFSLNSPESSSWDKLLALRNDYIGSKNSNWVDQDTAKRIVFSKLTDFKKIPLKHYDITKFNINLSALEEWAQEQDKPKKEVETNSIWDEMDEQAAGPEIEKKLRELRGDYRKKAYAKCQSEWNTISSCYKNSNCAPKSESEIRACQVEQCGNEPLKTICNGKMTCPPSKVNKEAPDKEEAPDDGVTRYHYVFCFPTYCDGIYVDNPKYREWKSCTESALECKVDNACVKKCNPNSYTSVDQCAEKAMQNGPTIQDAKKLIREGWKQKAAQPKSNVSQPSNFLD